MRTALQCFGVFLFVLVIWLVLFLGIRSALGAPKPYTFDDLRRSFVGVSVQHPADPKPYFSAGSGSVLYNNGQVSLVLTCAHVVRPPTSKIVVWAEDQNEKMAEIREAVIQHIDEKNDLALLLVDGAIGKPIAMAKKEPPRFARLMFLGNGQDDGGWASDGILSSKTFMLRDKLYWRVTGFGIYGMSGGPIVDLQGRLVCVLSNLSTHEIPFQGEVIRTPASGFILCVPLPRISAFLDGVVFE